MLYQYYTQDAKGNRMYFTDIKVANAETQAQANNTGMIAWRYDIHGGKSMFKPQLVTSSLHDSWCDFPKCLGGCNCHLSNVN